MATNDNGISESSGPVDLDRLIGELETEAARRRADPGYPHDADARLHLELARRAPHAAGTGAVAELVAGVEEAAQAGAAPWAGAGSEASGRRRHRVEVLRRDLEHVHTSLTSLGLAAAAALDALSTRLEHLEHRIDGVDPRARPAAEWPPRRDEAPGADADAEAAAAAADAPRGPDAGSDDALREWWDELADALPTDARVLYAHTRADEVVARLRAAGVDAYGLTDTGPLHQPGPDVRRGDLLDHLRAVPDGALGAVLLVGPPDTMSPQTLGPTVAELARVARTAVIVSEAPWWWRLRLGAVDADLAPGRPVHPDTWLHAFHQMAMSGSAHYGASGHSYRVVVRAHE